MNTISGVRQYFINKKKQTYTNGWSLLLSLHIFLSGVNYKYYKSEVKQRVAVLLKIRAEKNSDTYRLYYPVLFLLS